MEGEGEGVTCPRPLKGGSIPARPVKVSDRTKKLAVSTRILSRGPCEEVPGVDMIKHKETKEKVYNSPLFLGLNRAICKAGFQSAEGIREWAALMSIKLGDSAPSVLHQLIRIQQKMLEGSVAKVSYTQSFSPTRQRHRG